MARTRSTRLWLSSSLILALVAACQPAQLTALAPTTASPSALPSSSPATVAAAATPVPAASLAPAVPLPQGAAFSGVATTASGALANATVQAYALGHTQVLAAAKTDATGHYQLPLTGIAAGSDLTITASDGTTTLGTVAVAPSAAHQERLLDTSATVNLSLATTLALLILQPRLQAFAEASGGSGDANAQALAQAFNTLVTAFQADATALAAIPGLALALNVQGQGQLADSAISAFFKAVPAAAISAQAAVVGLNQIITAEVALTQLAVTPGNLTPFVAGSTTFAGTSSSGGSGGGGSGGGGFGGSNAGNAPIATASNQFDAPTLAAGGHEGTPPLAPKLLQAFGSDTSAAQLGYQASAQIGTHLLSFGTSGDTADILSAESYTLGANGQPDLSAGSQTTLVGNRMGTGLAVFPAVGGFRYFLLGGVDDTGGTDTSSIGSGTTNSDGVLNVDYNDNSASLPVTEAFAATVVLGNQLFLLGGRQSSFGSVVLGSNVLSATYDSGLGTLGNVTPTPGVDLAVPIYWGASVVTSDGNGQPAFVYVFGGLGENGDSVDTVQVAPVSHAGGVYSLGNFTVAPVQLVDPADSNSTARARAGCSAVVAGGAVYVLGGTHVASGIATAANVVDRALIDPVTGALKTFYPYVNTALQANSGYAATLTTGSTGSALTLLGGFPSTFPVPTDSSEGAGVLDGTALLQ